MIIFISIENNYFCYVLHVVHLYTGIFDWGAGVHHLLKIIVIHTVYLK